jgi:hypothetical protein
VFGCKNTSTHNSINTYQDAGADQQATVILSVRYDNHCEESPYFTTLIIENISNNKKSTRALKVYNRMTAGDFDDPPGYFYVQNWPAGQYHIFSFKSFNGYSTELTLDMNVYFDLAPGTVNYLGQLLLTIPKCNKYKIAIQDDIGTALNMLKERGSDIEISSIKSRVRELYMQTLPN